MFSWVNQLFLYGHFQCVKFPDDPDAIFSGGILRIQLGDGLTPGGLNQFSNGMMIPSDKYVKYVFSWVETANQ